jgi:hypothetical protein
MAQKQNIKKPQLHFDDTLAFFNVGIPNTSAHVYDQDYASQPVPVEQWLKNRMVCYRPRVRQLIQTAGLATNEAVGNSTRNK